MPPPRVVSTSKPAPLCTKTRHNKPRRTIRRRAPLFFPNLFSSLFGAQTRLLHVFDHSAPYPPLNRRCRVGDSHHQGDLSRPADPPPPPVAQQRDANNKHANTRHANRQQESAARALYDIFFRACYDPNAPLHPFAMRASASSPSSSSPGLTLQPAPLQQ
jgi:hypothetical protein